MVTIKIEIQTDGTFPQSKMTCHQCKKEMWFYSISPKNCKFCSAVMSADGRALILSVGERLKYFLGGQYNQSALLWMIDTIHIL